MMLDPPHDRTLGVLPTPCPPRPCPAFPGTPRFEVRQRISGWSPLHITQPATFAPDRGVCELPATSGGQRRTLTRCRPDLSGPLADHGDAGPVPAGNTPGHHPQRRARQAGRSADARAQPTRRPDALSARSFAFASTVPWGSRRVHSRSPSARRGPTRDASRDWPSLRDSACEGGVGLWFRELLIRKGQSVVGGPRELSWA